MGERACTLSSSARGGTVHRRRGSAIHLAMVFREVPSTYGKASSAIHLMVERDGELHLKPRHDAGGDRNNPTVRKKSTSRKARGTDVSG